VCSVMDNLITDIRILLQNHYPQREAMAIARLILEEVFAISPLDIYMGKDIQLSENDREKLQNIIARLHKYEPIQYVLGYSYFCGRRFRVSPNVLIPRPETEELIGTILHRHSVPPHRVLDIGTGSGCIPITLATHWPDSHIKSWDISEDALALARQNNDDMQTHVVFKRNDILNLGQKHDDLKQGFDLIVSNPPYVKQCEQQEMERHVLDWEPALALFVPDDDPLLFYRTIVSHAADGLLLPGGWIYFEINREYGHEVAGLLENSGFLHTEVLQDLSGNDRIVCGQLA